MIVPPTAAAAPPGLPAGAGVGAKPQHFEALLADSNGPAFIEVHAENYMGAGGPPHAWLRRLRERYPLSLHGVGLSIGGEDDLDEAHLARIDALVRRYEPAQFSEHLAWSSHGGIYFNDLLPLRYDRTTLARVCTHLDRLQDRLGRRVLLENPSTYVELEGGDFDEAAFLGEVVRRSGCGVLLDLNNAHVSAHNHGRDVHAYLDGLPLDAVGQVHLAGHARERDASGAEVLVDDHGSQVAAPVWELFDRLLARTGPLPTLIEWDTDVPDYAVLRKQATRAAERLVAWRSAA